MLALWQEHLSHSPPPFVDVRAVADGQVSDITTHCVEGDSRACSTNQHVQQLATRLCNMLKKDLDRFEQEDAGTLEGRTKTMMAFAKTIQFLEELIKRMEVDGSSQYPQESVDFHKKLERQIEVLADIAFATAISSEPDSA